MNTRLSLAALVLAALAAAPAIGQDRILASQRPPTSACPAGGPLQVWLLQQSSSTDCDNTVSGTVDALCCCINNTWGACSSGGGGGSGTVTSVALSAPAIFTLSGSPITTSGTFTLGLATQIANTVWAGPTTGSAAAPAFRALVDADIPITIAPYGLHDQLAPPVSVGTGGCLETYDGGAEQCSWSWGNQDSAAIAFNQGSAVLDGDTTDEIHIRGFNAATNADQTLTARMNSFFDGATTSGDMCGIFVISAGTVASLTTIHFSEMGDHATDGIYWLSDNDYNPNTASVLGSQGWAITNILDSFYCHQFRYTDSTRALSFWYSTGPECLDFVQLGSAATLAADPVAWGVLARRDGACRFQRVQLRTDTDRNYWVAP